MTARTATAPAWTADPLAADWTVHPLDGGALLSFTAERKLVWLNGTAGWTWLRLAGGDTVEACAAALAPRLGLSPAAARSAVESVPAEVAEALATPEHPFRPELCPTRPAIDVTPAAAGLYRVGGRTLRIACARRTDHRAIAAALGHLALTSAPEDTPVDCELTVPAAPGMATLDGREGAALSGRDDLLPTLAHVLFAVWYRARADYLALHAGLVEVRGRGLLLPGASGRGKTTAVAALISLGGTYLSDDVVALSRTAGRAYGFPFPLNVKEANVQHLAPLFPSLRAQPEQRRNDGTRLRLLPPALASDRATTVDCIVFPRFRARASVDLKRVPPGEVLERLAREWVVEGRPAPEDLDGLVAWLAATPAVELTYPDPHAAASALERLIDTV